MHGIRARSLYAPVRGDRPRIATGGGVLFRAHRRGGEARASGLLGRGVDWPAGGSRRLVEIAFGPAHEAAGSLGAQRRDARSFGSIGSRPRASRYAIRVGPAFDPPSRVSAGTNGAR